MNALPGELEIGLSTQIEIARIGIFLKRADILSGKITIHPNGELGYVINPATGEPRLQGNHNMLVLFDFDDVVNRTTDGIHALIQEIDVYCQRHEMQLSREQVTEIVRGAERFSSWRDGDSSKDIAHPNAQILAMQFILDTIRHSSDHIEGVAASLQTLSRIKEQTSGAQTHQEGDPFRFNNRGTLVKLGDKHLWDQELQQIYLRTFFGPQPVLEMIKNIKTMREQGIEVGIFTSGDPSGQIMRILELLGIKGSLPVDHLWLAKGDKGLFIKELIRDGRLRSRPIQTQLTLNAVDTVVLFDDSPSALNTVIDTNATRRGREPFFVGVRYRLSGGYAELQEWNPKRPHRSIKDKDLLSPNDIIRLLKAIHRETQGLK